MANRIITILFGTIILIAGSLGCAEGGSANGCGDNICQSEETTESCPEDCTSLCGNSVLDENEACDGQEFNETTCESKGFLGGPLSCNDDCTIDTSNCTSTCSSQCTSAGDFRCSGNFIETCINDLEGCLQWENSTDCTLSSQVCDDSSGTAHCSDTCSNACTSGERRCQDNLLQSCQLGENGCTQWKDEQDCSLVSWQCDVFEGSFACVDPCDHQCEFATPDQCSSDSIQTCNTDQNGCRVWQNMENCSLSGRSCSMGSCICVDECTTESTRCSASLRQTCVSDTYGCFAWETAEDCTNSGNICDTSSGTAQCVLNCTNACTDGETSCLGDVSRICALQVSGCYDWQDVENCGTSGRNCSSGSCVCDNNCSAGQTDCVGDITRQCEIDSWGCYHFANITNCSATSQICVDGSCESTITSYLCTGVTTYTTINTLGTPITTDTDADDALYQFTIPFSYMYYGASYTVGYVSTNGWVSFGSDPGTSAYVNTILPTTYTPNAAIYVFWDDLLFDQSIWPNASIYTQTIGTAPNRTFIIEWYHLVAFLSGNDHQASFQLRLQETTNVFGVYYDRNNWLGASYSATIGTEDAFGTTGADIGSDLSAPPAEDYECLPQ
jgi:hypothetical protein